MKIKYDLDMDNEVIRENLKRIINQLYKLLPMREEGEDWRKPLSTLLEELSGMDRLFFGQLPIFFSLLCKMEGLFVLTEAEDFQCFRRTIFECLSLLEKLKSCLT